MSKVSKETFKSFVPALIVFVQFVILATALDDMIKMGDMMLTKDQLKLFENPGVARNAYEKSDYRWPLNIVPVVFSTYDVEDEDYANLEEFIERFKSAAAQISRHSCIEFHFYNESTIVKGKYPKLLEVDTHPFASCETTVGYTLVGRRVVKISRNETACNQQDIVHVILHVLGFFHMNNSPDRDQYVTVDWGNIRGQSLKLFNPVGKRVNRFGTAYDYNSMMHDGPYFGSKEPGKLKTLIPRAPNGNRDYGDPKRMGERRGLTKGDAVRVRLMYDCENPYGFNK